MSALPLNTLGSKAGLREWIGLAVLALPTLLVAIDVSVIILALPHIGQSLGADSAQLLWIMDIYGFMLAGFMITMGTLGDRIGRRKLMMIGGTAFAVASVLAAFSPNAETLILSRALLGIAGATISPSILALITNLFRDEAQRGFAISIWLTCFMGGMALGPVVGGVMLEHFWWGSVFLLGVPVMLLLLVTGLFLLPEFRDPSAGKLDLLSVGLSLVAILPTVYGLKEIAKTGVSASLLASIAVGIAFGIVFAIRQTHLTHPLLDLKLFRNQAFATAVGGMFLVASTGALMLFVSQYLQLVLSMSPLESGLWTLPGVGASVVGFMLSPVLAKRIRPAPLIAGGLLLSVAGGILFTQLDASTGLAMVVIGFVLFNLGCAPMVTLASGIVVGSVPPERAGSAAATQETCAELGFALGIASLGSIGTAVYRAAMAGQIPAEVPAAAAEAARDTLAGAVAAAQNLPAELGTSLVAAGGEAFVSGMHVVAGIATLALLAVAVLAWTMFRHLPPLGEMIAAPEALPAGLDDDQSLARST